MYHFSGFSKRLLDLRKQAGFTQEEMAAQLGVSPQAVSKWENDVCYPDITLLPKLAVLLNTRVDTLFGGAATITLAENGEPEYPALHNGLTFIHAHKGIAVYAEKPVSQINGAQVHFTDGSLAQLDEHTIINKGTGEIKLLFMEDSVMPQASNRMEMAEFAFTDSVCALCIRAVRGNYRINLSNDAVTRIKVSGSAGHVKNFKAQITDGTLICEERQEQSQNNNNALEVIIHMAQGDYESADFSIAGSGEIHCAIPVQKANMQINGSGDMVQADISASTNVQINGSGDIRLHRCHQHINWQVNGSGDIHADSCDGETQVKINGSGDIAIDRITGCFEGRINGSGDITLTAGDLRHFSATIRGSGDMQANGVATQTADLDIGGSGTVALGHVRGESIEKVGKNAAIIIHKRG